LKPVKIVECRNFVKSILRSGLVEVLGPIKGLVGGLDGRDGQKAEAKTGKRREKGC